MEEIYHRGTEKNKKLCVSVTLWYKLSRKEIFMLGLGLPEILLILVIALLIFGAAKLPEIGKSLGKALSEFKKGTQEFKEEKGDDGKS